MCGIWQCIWQCVKETNITAIIVFFANTAHLFTRFPWLNYVTILSLMPINMNLGFIRSGCLKACQRKGRRQGMGLQWKGLRTVYGRRYPGIRKLVIILMNISTIWFVYSGSIKILFQSPLLLWFYCADLPRLPTVPSSQSSRDSSTQLHQSPRIWAGKGLV